MDSQEFASDENTECSDQEPLYDEADDQVLHQAPYGNLQENLELPN